MADSTIPNLVAVTVPALTDLFGVRQSGDARDKKLTAAQLISLVTVSVPDPLLLGSGSAIAPTYSFTSSPTSGLFRSGANQLEMSIAGTAQFAWFSNFYMGKTSGAGFIRNIATSATQPTLSPSNADLDTGIGSAGADVLSLIAGGVEGLQVAEAVGLITIPTFGPILAPDGTAAVPSYSFTNDPDTGFFKIIDSELNVSVDGIEVGAWGVGGGAHFSVPSGTSAKAGLGFLTDDNTGFHNPSNGIINVALDGTTTWAFTATSFGATQSGARPALQDQVATATVPNIVPNKDDLDTGIGEIQADAPVIIAGGQTALGFLELNDGVVQFPAADTAITALAGGGQGGAGALKQSYNVISVAATAGDSVTLPSLFFANSLCFIKNDGANSVDVFPASGDDLGQGLNVAEPLAAGTGIFYIATVLNATWTPLIVAQAATFSGPSFASSNAAGPAMLNEDASGTNPTLIPDQANPSTGIGSATTDQMNFIGGGLTCMSISNVAGVRRIGFYEGAPIALQTGVAVTTAAIHAALVALRLITA